MAKEIHPATRFHRWKVQFGLHLFGERLTLHLRRDAGLRGERRYEDVLIPLATRGKLLDQAALADASSSGDDHKARGALLGQPSKRIELIFTVYKRAFQISPFVTTVGTKVSPNRKNVSLVMESDRLSAITKYDS